MQLTLVKYASCINSMKEKEKKDNSIPMPRLGKGKF